MIPLVSIFPLKYATSSRHRSKKLQNNANNGYISTVKCRTCVVLYSYCVALYSCCNIVLCCKWSSLCLQSPQLNNDNGNDNGNDFTTMILNTTAWLFLPNSRLSYYSLVANFVL